MIQVAVLYPSDSCQRFDTEYYQERHFALVRRLLMPRGLRGATLDIGLPGPGGEPPPFHAVGSLLFDSLEAFQEAIGEVGADLAADGPNYTDGEPIFQVSTHHDMMVTG